MSQTLVTKAHQFTLTGKEFVAFASDFGIKPGEWPMVVVVEDHVVPNRNIPLVFRWSKPRLENDDLVAVIYVGMGPAYPDYEVHLVND